MALGSPCLSPLGVRARSVRLLLRSLVIGQLILLGVGCAGDQRPFVWVQNLPPAVTQRDGDGVIHPRDTIVVVVKDQPSLSGEFVVRDDGGYLQPTLGSIVVQGLAPSQLAEALSIRLRGIVVNPQATVSVARAAPIRVSVVGEVKTPGSYDLTRDRSVTAALAAAGWLTDFAAKDRIFVVRHGDGDLRVRFRAQEITTSEPHSASFRLRDGDVVVVE